MPTTVYCSDAQYKLKTAGKSEVGEFPSVRVRAAPADTHASSQTYL
jgi:hypothetical protein